MDENTQNENKELSPSPHISFKKLPSKSVLLLGSAFILLILVFSGLLFFSRRMASQPQIVKVHSTIPQNARFVPDQVIIKVQNGLSITDPDLQTTLKKLGMISYEPLYKNTTDETLKKYYIIKFKPGSDVRKIHAVLDKDNAVQSVDPNYVWQVFSVPNDPLYGTQWDMAKIQLDKARDITEGSADIKVAVIDSGVDHTQPDLPKNIQIGSDYMYSSSDDTDYLGHGTHVMGTIGALTDNSLGVSGINQNVSLLAIKVCGNTLAEGCTMGGIIQGIREAADKGARVVNMSLGGPGTCVNSAQDAINYALAKNVVIIAAAGNSSSNANAFQPASCSGVITVGATTPSDTRASFSNYGTRVDIAAPGQGILSTKSAFCSICNADHPVIGTNYVELDGTSMAAPHVAGVAALLLSKFPSMTPAQVKTCLIQSGDPISTDLPIGGVRLNAYRALTECSDAHSGPSPALSSSPSLAISPTEEIVASESKIEGTVFQDLNNNLKLDPGEGGYAGAVLTLEGPMAEVKMTGNDGKYSFTGLQVGKYTLTEHIGGQIIHQYKFELSDQHRGLLFDIPVPPTYISPTPSQDSGGGSSGTGSGSDSGTGSGSDSGSGAGSGGGSSSGSGSDTNPSVSPTPTPVVVYDCKMVSSPSNKSINLGYLQCTPLRVVVPQS